MFSNKLVRKVVTVGASKEEVELGRLGCLVYFVVLGLVLIVIGFRFGGKQGLTM